MITCCLFVRLCGHMVTAVTVTVLLSAIKLGFAANNVIYGSLRSHLPPEGESLSVRSQVTLPPKTDFGTS